ncbi:MAG: L,D-transpeptidase family protein [Omnitrophica bacterium]|nr:L,D-transpeptidase family protein [Candidatus Omnitrophota bacterium]
MNKKFAAIVIIAALGVILLSTGVKNIVTQKGELLVNKADLKNKKSLLVMAHDYEAKRKYLKTLTVLKGLIEEFPGSPEAMKAERDIERLNINILFSDIATDDSISYEIKPGDTLGGIAFRHNTTVELLKKANGLETNLILPGKHLKVTTAKFAIHVDKATNQLVLKKDTGEIIKTYAVSTGKDFITPTGTFKIEEKLVSPVWYKVGAIVEPDSAEYALGLRWMGLSVEGYGIHGTNDESSIGKYITKGCVRMRNEDVIELYAIVPSGIEVTIVE